MRKKNNGKHSFKGNTKTFTKDGFNDKDNNDSKKNDIKNNENSKKNSRAKNLIFNILTIICIVVIIFSSYNIVCWYIDNKNNSELILSIYEQTEVTQEEISTDNESIVKLHYDFTNLLSTNANTIGWIHVSNTNIDYPVVQYTDNDYYLTHSFDNSENSAGWIFADYQNKCDGTDYNTVIYGHNRKDKSMFGSLKYVLNSDWYSNEENLYINYSTINESHVYKIFTAFVCNDENVNSYLETSFSTDEDFNSYIQKLKNASTINFNTDLDGTEQIITLYTCYGLNNQRLLVCAKLVD